MHTDYGYGIGDMGSEGGRKGKASSIIGPRRGGRKKTWRRRSLCRIVVRRPLLLSGSVRGKKSQGEERIERKRPLSWKRVGERERERGRRMMTFPGRGDEIAIAGF